MDKELAPVVIDFSKNTLNEHWTDFFQSAVKLILRAVMTGDELPIRISGTSSQVNNFANTIGKEKKYIDAIRKFGLDDPRTHSNKSKLDSAVKQFERATGLMWPFK